MVHRLDWASKNRLIWGLDLVFDTGSGINEVDGNVASFEVYPNPATGIVRVKSELKDGNYSDLLVRVMTIDGRTVLENGVVSGLSDGIEMNVNSLVAGVYMVQLVQSQKAISAQKLIVQ